ncbi:MAG: DUF4139 domain-containing protein [Isosphaeraceae bacterium]
MKTNSIRGLLLLAGLIPALATRGQEPAKEGAAVPGAEASRSDFALTVYSSADPASFDPRQLAQNPEMSLYRSQVPGHGVVRETRRVSLDAGENTVRFTDVAAGIDPTTVAFKSLTHPGSTAVLEQDYAFDLIGSDKLLQKYLGQKIAVVTKNQAQIEATLLAAEPGMLVVQESAARGERLRMIPRGQELLGIELPRLPKGLITRPTLVWKVAAREAGRHEVQVSYQTDGLTWRADYNLVVSGDDTRADISAWVSLVNESGASYPDARLKLVAGDVRRVQPQNFSGMRGVQMMASAGAAPAPPGFQEKAFFEYHLYTLGRATSLADRSTKQIELFPAKAGVPVAKTYVYHGLPSGYRTFASSAPSMDRVPDEQANKKVDIDLVLKNQEANGLGLPLPAGRVRVYKRDEADAALEFVGEDTIAHTPKGEEVTVTLGSAFDVVGDRKVVDFQTNLGAKLISETVEVTLRNQKASPVRVIVKETLFRWLSWVITQTSDPYEKQDVRTVHFPVEVKPGGERKVRYTVRYTW